MTQITIARCKAIRLRLSCQRFAKMKPAIARIASTGHTTIMENFTTSGRPLASPSSNARSKQITRVNKNENAKPERDRNHHRAGPEENCFKVFSIARPELAHVLPGFFREISGCFFRCRFIWLNEEKRQRGPHLYQWWVLVVELELSRN